MLLSQAKLSGAGYTPIASVPGADGNTLMDFGILRLDSEAQWTCQVGMERAFLLIEGEAELSLDGNCIVVSRGSCFHSPPCVVRVDASRTVAMRALRDDTEFVIQSAPNPRKFESQLLGPSNIRDAVFGKGALNGTMERRVRTFFDAESAPESNVVMGEAINSPGRWSSYPPHRHPQPEVYYYRFERPEGFGFSAVGDSVYYVRNRDTVLIPPGLIHPQVAAPGFAMYFVWMIAHVERARFGANSREFLCEYSWLNEQ